MKQNLTLFVFLAIAISACQKEDPVSPVGEQSFPVSFRVTNVTQTVEDYNPATKAAPRTEDEFINHLWYFVYRDDGVLEWRGYQDDLEILENDHFGEVHLTLPEGDFRLIVVGARHHLTFPDSANYATAYFHHTAWWNPGDVFYKEISFSVAGEEIIETVKIDRISSMIEFDMTETATDLRYSYTLKYLSVRNYPFDENGEYEYDWLDLPQIDGDFVAWEQQNVLYRAIAVPPRGEKFDINPEVFILGPRFNSIFFNLNGVYVYPNKKTIVRGSLLHDNVYQNFYVDVDSTYADTTYLHTDDLVTDY